MISKLQCGFFFSVVFAICLTSSVTAQVKNATTLHALPGQGVADPGKKTGFFPNSSGGIDALNLATGKVLWSSKEASLPLITTQKYLFALKKQKNQLSVIKIDTDKQGKCLFESPPIPLPSWASIEPAYGRSFRSGVRLDNNGLFLIWEARAFYAGGAAPPPEVIAGATKYQAGVERIDSNTGKIESLGIQKIKAGKFFPISEATVNPKFGALTLLVKDSSANNPMNPLEKRRVLQAMNGAKQIVWQRNIAPPPIELLPLP